MSQDPRAEALHALSQFIVAGSSVGEASQQDDVELRDVARPIVERRAQRDDDA
jgi:hypothetical protein